MSTNKIHLALKAVNEIFPSVTHVMFNKEGAWFYCSDDFSAPDFDSIKDQEKMESLQDLLESAADQAYNVGLPCAFHLDQN